MKKTFAEKVQLMEREVEKTKKDLETTQKTLAHYEVKSHQEQNEKQKLEQEHKKKLQTLEEQLHELKKKQKVSQSYQVQNYTNGTRDATSQLSAPVSSQKLGHGKSSGDYMTLQCSTPPHSKCSTFLYFDLYFYSANTAHYVYKSKYKKVGVLPIRIV